MTSKICPSKRRLLVALLILGLATLPLVPNDLWEVLQPTVVSAAITFTVNSINDSSDSNISDGVCNDGSGNCTLRAAIEQANASPGSDTINFSIGSGVKTILLTFDLPIISDPLVIDGTTQPGFAGAPLIEINGGNRANTNRACFFITAGSSTIKGLVINRVNNAAITITTNDGNHIEGNFIGTDVTGSVRLPNSVGVIVNTSLNTIGGTTAASRNVVSGNNGTGIEFNVGTAANNVIEGNYIGVNAAGTGALFNSSQGIRVTGSSNRIGGLNPGAGNVISGNGQDGLQVSGQMNTVQGNFIGTNATGTAAIRNGDRGILVFNSPNNVIGGTVASARNVVSGNFGAGISIEESGSTGNVVQGNFIGTDVSGVVPLPNSPEGFGVPNTSGGIFINRGSNNLIGGAAPGAANTVAYNGGAGVRVVTLPNTTIGVSNRISRNFVFGNLGLGIDLGSNGVTGNDLGDSDTDANNLQNFPTITSVTANGGATTIAGTFASTPNTSFELEFYTNAGCHPSGNGEGATFFGMANVSTDVNGNNNFVVTFQSPIPAGRVFTVTATDPAGNTSEFSPCSANPATGIVKFASTTLAAREDVGMLIIPITRVGGSSGSVTVNFATSDDTAIAGQDYTALSGSLTFADGETSKTISLPIINDGLAESSETLFVKLTSPSSPDAITGSGISVIRIFDQNNLAILSVDGTTVNEGNSGATNVTVTVRLNLAIGQTVTVQFQSFEMTATSGIDFQPVSGMLTFAPGVTTQTLTVPIVGDVADEFDETFRIGLSNAVNAAIFVSSNPPVVLIVDDDPTPTIAVNDVGVIEGTSGTTDAVFTLKLSAKSGRQVSVNFATADGSATVGADYQSTNGIVFFNPGETTKTVTVLVNGDVVDEPLENFFLNLSTPNSATIADAQGVATIGTSSAAGVRFSAATFNATEMDHAAQIVVTRSGDTAAAITVDFATSDGTAAERSDYTLALGSLSFGAGETSKSFTVLLNEDAFQEGDETIDLRLTNPTGGSFIVGPNTAVLVVGDSTVSTINPIDQAEFFVRQHYHDFLNREPDTPGLDFWVGNITSCGADPQCIEVKRINVSAAFFLSIEFQETGYLVYRVHKSALGNLPSTPIPVSFIDLLRDTQEIRRGVQVGIGDWQAQLEANKQAYTLAFVQRSDFLTAFPNNMTAQQIVDKLNSNVGGALSASEQSDLLNLLGASPSDITKRSQVLRAVAEDTDLKTAELNRAFVLMEYFGYLRRSANDFPDSNFDGFNFWLNKLNQFGGNFVQAEMVKAFISSIEYRRRFGP